MRRHGASRGGLGRVARRNEEPEREGGRRVREGGWRVQSAADLIGRWGAGAAGAPARRRLRRLGEDELNDLFGVAAGFWGAA